MHAPRFNLLPPNAVCAESAYGWIRPYQVGGVGVGQCAAPGGTSKKWRAAIPRSLRGEKKFLHGFLLGVCRHGRAKQRVESCGASGDECAIHSALAAPLFANRCRAESGCGALVDKLHCFEPTGFAPNSTEAGPDQSCKRKSVRMPKLSLLPTRRSCSLKRSNRRPTFCYIMGRYGRGARHGMPVLLPGACFLIGVQVMRRPVRT